MTTWHQKSCHVVRLDKRRYHYPVDSIVAHKTIGQQRYFLFHCESFGVSDGTWKPEKNLDGVINKLQQYLKDNNLPYYTVVGLMGAVVDEINEFDENNWVVMPNLLEAFGDLFKQTFPNKHIQCQEYVDSFGETGIYFLCYVSHSYTIFQLSNRQIAIIGDGTNTLRRDMDTACYIKDSLNIRCKSVEWLYEAAVDLCASTAVLIALELAMDIIERLQPQMPGWNKQSPACTNSKAAGRTSSSIIQIIIVFVKDFLGDEEIPHSQIHVPRNQTHDSRR